MLGNLIRPTAPILRSEASSRSRFLSLISGARLFGREKDDETEFKPSCRIFTMPFGRWAFDPTSASAIPKYEATFFMPFRPANQLAIALNRVSLATDDFGKKHSNPFWHCVAFTEKHRGCFVLRTSANCNWLPESEYDFPEWVCEETLTMMEARILADRINRNLLERGKLPKRFEWVFAVRQLRKVGHQ